MLEIGSLGLMLALLAVPILLSSTVHCKFVSIDSFAHLVDW